MELSATMEQCVVFHSKMSTSGDLMAS